MKIAIRLFRTMNLRNAFRHAEAQRIEVEIRYDERELRLRARDDGKGIDPKPLSDHGRAGHFGLRGMKEPRRAGGRQTDRAGRTGDRHGSGTEYSLCSYITTRS